MTDRKVTSENWSSIQAYTLAVVCLLVGMAGGWFIRGSQSPATTPVANAATMPADAAGMNAQPTAQQLKHMAEKQAEPLLVQLRREPDNAELLASIGNIYYDTQQFQTAIDYYERALKVQPTNTSIRTDMATAYWYLGNADQAISEFNRVLSYEPNKANALFNLGIVKWQGKMDVNGAVAAWQKLLDTNPNYGNSQQVLKLMAEAKKHSGLKSGTSGKPLAN